MRVSVEKQYTAFMTSRLRIRVQCNVILLSCTNDSIVAYTIM